jgi:hypothetical protein
MELTMHGGTSSDRLAWHNEARLALRDPLGVLDVYERVFVQAVFDRVLTGVGLSPGECAWLDGLSSRVLNSVEEWENA